MTDSAAKGTFSESVCREERAAALGGRDVVSGGRRCIRGSVLQLCVCVCARACGCVCVCVCVCGGGNLVPTKSIITHKTIRRSSGFCPKFIGSKKSSI